MKMEKVPWDVGRGWGCHGGCWGVREKEGETQMLFGGAGGIRSFSQGNSPGCATVWLCDTFRRGARVGLLIVIVIIVIIRIVSDTVMITARTVKYREVDVLNIRRNAKQIYSLKFIYIPYFYYGFSDAVWLNKKLLIAQRNFHSENNIQLINSRSEWWITSCSVRVSLLVFCS